MSLTVTCACGSACWITNVLSRLPVLLIWMADINRMIFMMRIKKLMMPRLVITESGGLRGWVGQGVGVVREFGWSGSWVG